MIRPLALAEIAHALDLEPPAGGESLQVTAVSIDSRTVQPGQIFVALRGERFDAHDFADEVVRRGAAALVCSRDVNVPVPVLKVSDTEIALGRIGAYHRSLFGGTVVALTGSAGKTTTKDMIAALLAAVGPVLATRGNLNNEIGVPLTLLSLEANRQFAVIEMGAGKPGDIEYLAQMARPQVALLTNALPAHLERLGSLEEVARTKGAIYAALPVDGIAVLNADDPFAAYWAGVIGARRTLRFSALGAAGAELRASSIRMQDGCARFCLELPGEQVAVRLAVLGVQQVANALAAAAVGHALGLPGETIARALESLQGTAGRMRRLHGDAGALLIDDTYNANPGSVRAAIDTLAGLDGTRVLVLGNMAELGPDAPALHRACGVHARERGIDHLLATGQHAADVAAGFGSGAAIFGDREELIAAARTFDRLGSAILVKGSRSAGMESVITALSTRTSAPTLTGTH